MINQKKKIIYLVIIGVSVVGVLLVFKFGLNTPGSVPSADFTASPAANTSENSLQTELKKTNLRDLNTPEFPQASIFPANEKFNQELLESSVFKNLKDYELLTINKEELGKDNPFAE